MRTLSIRDLATLAYERGEEFDPAAMPTPALLEDLTLAGRARALMAAPSSYERRRRRRRERRPARAEVPDWLSPEDLLAPPMRLVHGEPI